MDDEEFLKEFTDEALELLDGIENDLLTIEEQGESLDDDLLNKVFRAAHTIKGGSGFFDLENMTLLAHKSETVLDLIRTRKIIANDEITNLLLTAFDQLRVMVNNTGDVASMDISKIIEGLDSVTSIKSVSANNDTTQSDDDEPFAESSEKLAQLQYEENSNAKDAEVESSEELEPELKSIESEQLEVAINNISTNGRDFGKKEITEKKPEATQADKALGTQVQRSTVKHADETLRISVGMLENLMNLAGELVLSRNQLRSAVIKNNTHLIHSAEQGINQVTTELQDTIMQTRLQPIGNVFNKFPRVVRDMAKQLGKEIELEIVGKEVALDKTLVEGISDPLMHMVRNAVDHGIESKEDRLKTGKPPVGTILIEAKHEAGQVIIEISDDGKGLDGGLIAESAVRKGLITEQQAWDLSEKEKLHLIFHAGLSTAKKVSDLSGRGVGMDVVKTNINRLNGQIEITSDPGFGSTFRIKLPLTLAIIPCLIVMVGKERFSIPQSNIKELISIRNDEIDNHIEILGNSEVLIVREKILPLVRFREFGKIESENVAGAHKDANEIVIVTDGDKNFAVLVDWFENTEEVVVKPLSQRLKHLTEYSGATILGDGSVAMILDINGLAAKANVLNAVKEIENEKGTEHQTDEVDLTPYLLFGNARNEQYAIPLDAVGRIERIRWSDIEYLGGKRTMQYRNGMLQIYSMSDLPHIKEPDPDAVPVVIVSEVEGRMVGLLGTTPVNVVDLNPDFINNLHRRVGIQGSLIAQSRTTLIADLQEIVGQRHHSNSASNEINDVTTDDFSPSSEPLQIEDVAVDRSVLLAEDSDFFRNKIKKNINESGFHVFDAEDGEKAWSLLLEQLDRIELVVTDLEMPHMDGLELTRKIRSDHRTADLPIIAVTSLASEEDIQRGIEAGVTEYQIKLDREKLIASIQSFMKLTTTE